MSVEVNYNCMLAVWQLSRIIVLMKCGDAQLPDDDMGVSPIRLDSGLWIQKVAQHMHNRYQSQRSTQDLVHSGDRQTTCSSITMRHHCKGSCVPRNSRYLKGELVSLEISSSPKADNNPNNLQNCKHLSVPRNKECIIFFGVAARQCRRRCAALQKIGEGRSLLGQVIRILPSPTANLLTSSL